MKRDLDPVWKALADPVRRGLLDLLRDGGRTTGQLCAEFDELSRYAVMKHLSVLERASLLVVRRDGRLRWNYLNPVPLQMIYERWISPYVRMWAVSLLDLKRTVETRQRKRAARELPHKVARELAQTKERHDVHERDRSAPARV